MRCQRCHSKPATIRVLRVVGGQKQEEFLCQECASARDDMGSGFQPGFPFGNLLAGMMGDDWWSGVQTAPVTSLRCERCGLTHHELSRSGLMGCGDCYQALGRVIDPILARVHGYSRHAGKVPGRTADRLSSDRRLQQLKNHLDQLVKKEEFEQAAVVRDQIRDLEREREGEATGDNER